MMGYECELRLIRRAIIPGAEAAFEAVINPSNLKKINFDPTGADR